MAETTQEEIAKVAKEKAEQAKKAAQEALDKAKNMSADEVKELAKEKLEKMKRLDNSSKMKYGGIAAAALLGIYLVFGGSSYDEEFIKAQISVPSNSEILSYEIVSEESIEAFGQKGMQLALDVTYKYNGTKYVCGFEEKDYSGWSKYTIESNTKEGCTKADTATRRNFKLKREPGNEFSEGRTVLFGKADIARWEKKHS
jgi:ElaB/YqjD/DUF883 family membrane-anchored ribosome-binding protein